MTNNYIEKFEVASAIQKSSLVSSQTIKLKENMEQLHRVLLIDIIGMHLSSEGTFRPKDKICLSFSVTRCFYKYVQSSTIK